MRISSLTELQCGKRGMCMCMHALQPSSACHQNVCSDLVLVHFSCEDLYTSCKLQNSIWVLWPALYVQNVLKFKSTGYAHIFDPVIHFLSWMDVLSVCLALGSLCVAFTQPLLSAVIVLRLRVYFPFLILLLNAHVRNSSNIFSQYWSVCASQRRHVDQSAQRQEIQEAATASYRHVLNLIWSLEALEPWNETLPLKHHAGPNMRRLYAVDARSLAENIRVYMCVIVCVRVQLHVRECVFLYFTDQS